VCVCIDSSLPLYECIHYLYRQFNVSKTDVHTCALITRNALTNSQTYIILHTRSHTHTHTHTDIHTLLHTLLHFYTNTHTHCYTHAHTHSYLSTMCVPAAGQTIPLQAGCVLRHACTRQPVDDTYMHTKITNGG